ncbi:MAG: Asp23/Gls24 family envelope stress response protein [Clostridiales Family XIII bacterium]|nr:Asp23/Gls24 family envelope stress response protein [Clostridiales Family XIII bacterium]
MRKQEDGKDGAVNIASEVIVTYISEAVLGTPGVADLSPLVADTISHTILGKDSRFKGIKFSESEHGLTIEVYVIIRFGEWIPDVAWNIQQNVKNSLKSVMDVEINAVNIHVQGVARAETGEVAV